MRTIVALVALLLAVCQVKADAVHGGFDDGKRYVYNYAARVGTGVADGVQQFSGFGVKGHLLVQREGSNLIVELHDLELGSYNKQLHNLKDVVDIEYKRPASGLENFEKPFIVHFKEGVFSSIEVPETDDFTVRNNKKAIASLLQLDMRREKVEHLHFYSTKEESIGGKCLTHYTVGHFHERHHLQEDVLNVTKLRHYDQCDHYPHLFHSSISAYECTDCKQEHFHPLKNLAEIHYDLKGTREHYTIEHVYATGAITFTPFSTNGQTVLSMVNQTLDLIKIVDAQPLAVESKLYECKDLQYEFREDHRDYKNVDLKKAHYYNRAIDVDRTDRLAKAEAIMHQLENDLKHEETTFASHYVPSLIDIFSTFDYEDFVKFYGKFVLVAEPHSAEFHLLEILPVVGTNPAIQYALDKIQSGEIDDSHAKKILAKIPFYAKEPSKALLDAFVVMGKSKHVTESRPLFIASRLAFGTLLYKACETDLFNPHPFDAKHYVADCSSYIQKIIEVYKSADSDEKKSVYLRTLANSGNDAAVKFFIDIINSKEDNLLKQAAIWALADHFEGPKHKAEISAALAPVFLNIEEDYVMRIYAFESILQNYPSPVLFGKLIHVLHEDPSQKFKSYVYASLLSYVNTTDPCFEDFKQPARYVLQFLEKYQRDVINDPIRRTFSVYNAKYNYGRSTHFAVVPSDDSIFPRELYLRQSANLFGYNIDALELGYTSKGQTFHEEVLGELGLAPKGLYPYKTDVKHELVKSTLNKFHFKNGFEKKIHPYEVYAKVFGQDVYVTRDIAEDMASKIDEKEVKMDGKKFTLDINKVNFHGIELLIPNELGMPVVLKSRIPVTAHIHGSLTFDIGANGVSLDSDLHMGIDATVYSRVAVKSTMFGDMGYSLKTEFAVHVPIKGHLGCNHETGETKINYIPSAEPYDILQFQSVPQTVLRGEYLPVHYTANPINKQYSIGHDYFGVGVTYNFTYDYYWNDYGSYRQFLKSFFKKSSSYEEYFYLSDKWYAFSRNFLDYAVWNPTAKPFYFNARFSRCSTNPTTEFVYTSEKHKDKAYDFSTNKGQLKFDSKCHLVGKGPVERTFDTEFHIDLQWPYRDLRHVKFHFKRSPLPNYDAQPFEVCYDATVSISDFIKIYSMQSSDVKVKYDGHLTVGQDCSDKSKHVDIKGVLEKSDEQRAVDKNTIPYYKKCQELVKKGFHFNQYCWKYILELGRLNKITLDVDYKNIPTSMKGAFYRFYAFVRHRLYNNLYIDYEHGCGKENHFQITANASFEHPTVVDWKIARTDQTVYYNKVYMPSILPQFETFTVAEPLKERLARKIFNYHAPMCFITGKYARTFDNVVYKLPLEDCYHLAFADTHWHHVYIYYRSIKDGKYTKEALVYFNYFNKEHEIKFGATGGKIVITVDGNQVLHDGKDAHFFEEKGLGAIYKFADGYGISSKKLGLDFYYDGVNSVIAASNHYRGKQHGLCGDFDGETHNEFKGPDGHIYDDGAGFAHSYLVPEPCSH